jgi:hypothetical protein
MPDETTPAPAGEQKPIDQATLHAALKAFKKRIKAVRLDDESRLGGHGLSSGRQSGIFGITPPNLYPREVWDELVRVGRLKKTRDGLYEMTET